MPWLAEGANRDLYLVGGAWRALARIHMAQTGYPLQMVHHYTISREEARDLTGVIAGAGRRALERLPGLSRRRIDDLPFAAVALRRVLRATGVRRVVFSASGLREGWFMQRMPERYPRAGSAARRRARTTPAGLGRDPDLPPALLAWTDPLFPQRRRGAHACARRHAGCPISAATTIRSSAPNRRSSGCCASPASGSDHHARAFLALATAMRYEVDPDAMFLRPARLLLDVSSTHRAEMLGVALRLAYTLSAGTPDLLAGTGLRLSGNRLILRLEENSGVFAGESVMRRLDRLAQAVGLDAATETVRERVA